MRSAHDVRVLALNAGSSSLKFGLYRVGGETCDLLLDGEAEDGRLWAKDASGRSLLDEAASADMDAALTRIISMLAAPPDIVGHRIVHGGPEVRRHCLIDDAVLKALEGAAILAPLHVPPALAMVRHARARFPHAAQAACLDTAFHADMPRAASTYPLPEAIRDAGVLRYGFHGLSCESILRQLARDVPERLIIAHLGGGCSVTAVRRGRSVDTSMGLTPSGGLMMATRCGDIDPGALIYLMRERGLDADALERLVDRESGLMGIAGTGVMQILAPREDPDARLAIQMFQRSAAKAIAGMMAVLGGADLIVFTGGIGEHDARLREAVCGALAWSGAPHRAMPSREDEEIARLSRWLAAPGA